MREMRAVALGAFRSTRINHQGCAKSSSWGSAMAPGCLIRKGAGSGRQLHRPSLRTIACQGGGAVGASLRVRTVFSAPNTGRHRASGRRLRIIPCDCVACGSDTCCNPRTVATQTTTHGLNYPSNRSKVALVSACKPLGGNHDCRETRE